MNNKIAAKFIVCPGNDSMIDEHLGVAHMVFLSLGEGVDAERGTHCEAPA